jgi:hypothetical protein
MTAQRLLRVNEGLRPELNGGYQRSANRLAHPIAFAQPFTGSPVTRNSFLIGSNRGRDCEPKRQHGMPRRAAVHRGPGRRDGLHHHNQTRPATKTIMKLINGNVTAMSVSAVSENPTCF